MKTGEKDKGSVCSFNQRVLSFSPVLGTVMDTGDTVNKTGKSPALRKLVFQLGETDNKQFYEVRWSQLLWKKIIQDKGAEEC